VTELDAATGAPVKMLKGERYGLLGGERDGAW